MLSFVARLPLLPKLMLPLGLLTLLSLGVGGYGLYKLQKADAAYSNLLDTDTRAAIAGARLNQRALDLGRLAWRSAALQDEAEARAGLRAVETIGTEFTTQMAIVYRAIAGRPEHASLAGIESEFQALRATVQRAMNLVLENKGEEARTLLLTQFGPRLMQLRPRIAALVDRLDAMMDRTSRDLTEATEQTIATALLVLAITVPLTLALAVAIVLLGVLRPLKRLDAGMARVATGDFVTAIPDTGRGDEVGTMARTLAKLREGLAEAEAQRTAREAEKLQAEQERRAATLAMADNLERSVGGIVTTIAAAASELNAAASAMVGIAQDTTARAEAVSQSTAAANGSVATVAAATEELAASVAEIARQVSDSAAMAADTAAQAERSDANVRNLTEAADRIGEVTRLIGDIAGQTNLLALNATIEAARAGEAGKGFAVVASEVKTLASQTAKATESIAQQIQAMQNASRDTAHDIGEIRTGVTRISEVSSAIAAAVEEQGAATRDIAENVQRAAAGTSEVASAITVVSTAATETGGAASQVQSTSNELAQQAETLKREMGDFLGRLRAA